MHLNRALVLPYSHQTSNIEESSMPSFSLNQEGTGFAFVWCLQVRMSYAHYREISMADASLDLRR